MIEIERSNIEVPVFTNRSAEFYATLADAGFALLEFGEVPSAQLVDATRQLRTDGEPDQLIVDHVFQRLSEVDETRHAAGLPRIESQKVEVFVKDGLDGSGNPHLDRMHRDRERVIEVIAESRTWHLWLPKPELIKGVKASVKEGVEPDVVITATPGSALVINMRAPSQTHADAAKHSVIHSYFPSSNTSLSLLYARMFQRDLSGRISALRYRPPVFPDFR